MTARLRRLLVVLCLLLGARAVRADVPDPTKLRATSFSRGFFAEGRIGATMFLGSAAKVTHPGPAFGVAIGYDVFRWLALYVAGQGSIHEAAPPPPPVNQHFQTYLVAGGLRLSGAAGRLGASVHGTAGVFDISNNVLDRTGITTPLGRSAFVVGGGGALDWHTWNRHFSLGLLADYVFAAGLSNTSALTTTVYLRYSH